MITGVKIDGYKSFKNFELNLKPLMVLFGPNASGKSNFLDALQLVNLISTEENIIKAFEKHRGLPLESVAKINGPSDNKTKHRMKFTIDFNISDDVYKSVENDVLSSSLNADDINKLIQRIKYCPKNLSYILELGVKRSGETQIEKEKVIGILTDRNSAKTVFDKDELLRKGYIEKNEYRYHTILNDPSPFITAHTYPLDIVLYQIEMTGWRFYYFEPKILMREDSKTQYIEQIGSRGEHLSAFYYSLKNKRHKSFIGISKTLDFLIPGLSDFDVIHDEVNEKVMLRVGENDHYFSAGQISEGTLRILGILAVFHSLKKATLIGFEEPENGITPSRLKLVADIFRNMVQYQNVQVILNTHSPDFVQYFKDEECFFCAKENGLTSVTPLIDIEPEYRKEIIKESLCDTKR